ncbi:MAG TPA: pyridoxine 5'-phosphate oxidase C-terminal domain-containing protein, partial [Solirubrobacteraceae bacterium]|nr:pyridoxine 5'-phosphate oxidase C-terminal domain-containing protein [Solirubrobacteraceae bacterium]
QRVAELEAQYDGQQPPLPESWGGFRLRPVTVELWQQRHDRLHDRLRYRRSVEHEASWIVERLAP